MEKTECFADDANACCEQSVTAVDAILGILYNFGMISWLKCNIEKTTVMLIGPKLPDVEHRIIEVGFNLVERQRVLGFYLSNETEEFCNINWNKAVDKIRLIIEHWKKFNLSMIGRINISKTFLISQLPTLVQF